MPTLTVSAPFTTATEYFERQKGALRIERSSFTSHWQELSQFGQPRRGRFSVTDVNKGDRRHLKIINSTAIQALRTAVAGMMSGLTSPTRPWLRFEHPDKALNEFKPVKEFLSVREQQMYRIFERSNLYNMLPILYEEALLFATGAMLHDSDPLTISRFYTHTIGSYYISTNARGDVDTFYRDFQMQVRTMVKKFGLKNCSIAVQDAYNNLGNYYAWYPVTHAIEPNPDYNSANPFSKRYRSVYYEPGNTQLNKVLSNKGYSEFPVYVPRWEITGEDIYGTNCPGMTALGDIKGLQIEERRKAQGIDKLVNPPLQGPGSMKNLRAAHMPGGYAGYNDDPTRAQIKPIYQVEPRLREMMLDIEKVEHRIQQAFFADLFLAITNMEGVQPRNVMELAARNEEKLLMLGPVLERMYNDLLNPMVDRIWNQVDRIPPDMMAEMGLPYAAPPPELVNERIKVQYISILSQAQRAVATKTLERGTLFVGQLASASADPSVWDKIDKDQTVDEYSRLVGMPPSTIRSDDEVIKLREQRAQVQAAEAQQLAMAEQASVAADAGKAAKTFAEAGAVGEGGGGGE